MPNLKRFTNVKGGTTIHKFIFPFSFFQSFFSVFSSFTSFSSILIQFFTSSLKSLPKCLEMTSYNIHNPLIFRLKKVQYLCNLKSCDDFFQLCRVVVVRSVGLPEVLFFVPVYNSIEQLLSVVYVSRRILSSSLYIIVQSSYCLWCRSPGGSSHRSCI